MQGNSTEDIGENKFKRAVNVTQGHNVRHHEECKRIFDISAATAKGDDTDMKEDREGKKAGNTKNKRKPKSSSSSDSDSEATSEEYTPKKNNPNMGKH